MESPKGTLLSWAGDAVANAVRYKNGAVIDIEHVLAACVSMKADPSTQVTAPPFHADAATAQPYRVQQLVLPAR